MTPGERWKWAQRQNVNAKLAVYDAIEAAELAEMEYHHARFVYFSTRSECPTCGAAVGAYCGIWRTEAGEYVGALSDDQWRSARLIALFLHPARTTTPEVSEVAA